MIEVLVAITPAGLTLPVTFMHLVREHLNVGLVEAKSILDTLADNKSVTVRVASEPIARAFADAVEALGGLAATIEKPVGQ